MMGIFAIYLKKIAYSSFPLCLYDVIIDNPIKYTKSGKNLIKIH